MWANFIKQPISSEKFTKDFLIYSFDFVGVHWHRVYRVLCKSNYLVFFLKKCELKNYLIFFLKIPNNYERFLFFSVEKEKSNAQFSMLICSATVSLALAGAIIISLWAIFGSWFFGLSIQIGCVTESQHFQQSYGQNEFNMNGFLLVWTVWILVAISTGLLYFLFEKLCVWLIFICDLFSVISWNITIYAYESYREPRSIPMRVDSGKLKNKKKLKRKTEMVPKRDNSQRTSSVWNNMFFQYHYFASHLNTHCYLHFFTLACPNQRLSMVKKQDHLNSSLIVLNLLNYKEENLCLASIIRLVHVLSEQGKPMKVSRKDMSIIIAKSSLLLIIAQLM